MPYNQGWYYRKARYGPWNQFGTTAVSRRNKVKASAGFNLFSVLTLNLVNIRGPINMSGFGANFYPESPIPFIFFKKLFILYWGIDD